MFLYNLGMTIWKAKRLTTTEGVLMAGLAFTAILYLPSLLEFDNYTVAIFYRWWTVHLWVEGVWEMIQGALLAYLLIRLSGIDREVMEKWLYVIVGLTFISGLLGTAHHYYFVGVPSYWLPLGGFFSALEPLVFVAMSAYAYQAIRRSGLSHPNTLALHWTLGSAIFSALGAGLLGLAHTWPSVNRWTHGTLITPMHGHSAFFGAYVMIVLAVITYAMPALMGHDESQRETRTGLWAFWLQVGGMFGMTMAFAAAGIGQVYLERVLGMGYLETQAKIQVHFLMLVATGTLFTAGVALFLWDFFFLAPRQRSARRAGGRRGATAGMSDYTGRTSTSPSSGAEHHDGLRYPGPEAPFYLATGDEIAVFETCHARGLPVMLKGPTGCGKTRFVEHMAWRLGRPLVTVACHDDLSASDLTGRYLIRGSDTVWLDGPLTRAARHGAICYLDEIIEARQDTVVVIHPLTDDRRVLPLDKTGEILDAAPGFQLVISYNPGYQHGLKDLKPSTRQRFVALEFDFSEPGGRGGDRGTRERDRTRSGDRAGHTHESSPPARRPRSGRGAEHAPDRCHRAPRRREHSRASGLPCGPARPPHRRSRAARRHARSRELDDAVAGTLGAESDMAEPEELILEGAHFATRVAREAWRRYGASPDDRATALRAVRTRLEIFLTALLGRSISDRANGAARTGELARPPGPPPLAQPPRRLAAFGHRRTTGLSAGGGAAGNVRPGRARDLPTDGRGTGRAPGARDGAGVGRHRERRDARLVSARGSGGRRSLDCARGPWARARGACGACVCARKPYRPPRVDIR